jgi:hypothetical protein
LWKSGATGKSWAEAAAAAKNGIQKNFPHLSRDNKAFLPSDLAINEKSVGEMVERCCFNLVKFGVRPGRAAA